MTYYNDVEFMHHGILGQKWGVITRNVGVNYIPIGARSSGDSESSVGSKIANGAKAVGSGASRGAKALVKGAKKVKAEHDAEKAARKAQHSGYTEKLSKKDIAKMTNQEIQDAINRRRNEQLLYEMDNPTVKAGRDFFDNYVKKTVLDLAGSYGRKMLSMEADKLLRDFIQNNDRYDENTKRDLLNKLNVENLTDRLSREAYENMKRNESNIRNQVDNDARTRDLIKSMTGITEEQRANLLNRYGVETSDERLARESFEKSKRLASDVNNQIDNDKSVRNMIDSMKDLTAEQRSNLLNRYGVETSAERFARENSYNDAKEAAKRSSELSNIRDNIAYEMNRANAIRQVIDEMYDNEAERSQARIRNNVATENDLIDEAKRKAIISGEGKAKAGMEKIPNLDAERARKISYGFSKLDNDK